MTLSTSSEIRNVSGLLDEERALIKAFLQGAVYCWVKNRSGEWFAARDLLGGENAIWEGTPLQRLYDKQVKDGKSDDAAFDAAAIDAGWLLKAALSEDSRSFEMNDSTYTNTYRWIHKS